MEGFYVIVFGVAALVAAVLEYGNRMAKGAAQGTTPEFSIFKNNYLLVYSLGERTFDVSAACNCTRPS